MYFQSNHAKLQVAVYSAPLDSLKSSSLNFAYVTQLITSKCIHPPPEKVAAPRTSPKQE